MPTQAEWSAYALTGYTPGTRAPKPIAVLDIETDGLGGPFILGAFVDEHDTTVRYTDSIDTLMGVLWSHHYRGYVWYAHNGGEYDYKYLIDSCLRQYPGCRIRLISQGSSQRVIGAKLTRGKRSIEIRDSYALAPVSLRKLTQDFAPEFVKGYIDFDSERFDPHNEVHRGYLARDVQGLLHALLRLRGTLKDTFDVDMGWTSGATAMRAWRRTFAPGMVYWRGSDKREDFCRQAYHGGLVSLSTISPQTDVVDVDVNAMYAAAMRFGVPSGRAIWTEREVLGYPGIYHCRVSVPHDLPFTFLPFRLPQHNTLCWPTGNFSSYLTSIEIEAARIQGCSVVTGEGVVFDEIAYPFNTFIDRCQELELQATSQDSAVKMIAKLMRNSLYGKFGSRPTQPTLMFDPPSPIRWTPVIDRASGAFYGLYSKEETLVAPYIHPEWAAWITARARLLLLEYVLRVGAQNVYYTDTDSLKVQMGPVVNTLPFGRAYGQVKRVHDFTYFQAGGPKNYIGQLTDGTWIHACKGIPQRVINPEQHLRALNGSTEKVSFTSLHSTRTVVGTGRAYAQQYTRTYSSIAHSLGWRVLGDKRVRPIHLAG